MISAIVILNYNSSELTIKYLNDIISQNIFNHIVVVDNASNKHNFDRLTQFCGKNDVILLAQKKNRGYSAGNNAGARYAIEKLKVDIVFISNPDIICPRETIQRIESVFSESEDIAVVTGLVYVFDNERNPKPYKYFAYKVPTYRDMVLNNFYMRTKFKMEVLKNSIHYNVEDVISNQTLQVECVSGCFFAIRSRVFKEIDGFDEDTFLYYEEAILGFLLKKAHYGVYVVSSPVYHDEDRDKRRTIKKLWKTHSIARKSARLYLKKYLQINDVLLVVYDLSAGLGFIEQCAIHVIKKLNRK